MAQIINITSEALQATIRRLLPSQQGFGEDLQATNVVTPIIDLTPTAEGSQLPTNLQNAYFLGQTTSTLEGQGTQTAINTPGFWKIQYQMLSRNAGTGVTRLRLKQGGTETDLVKIKEAANATGWITDNVIYVFLAPSDEFVLNSSVTESYIHITARQIADVQGNLINPTGFSPQ